MRQRPGSSRGIGGCQPVDEIERPQSAIDVVEELLFAAEEMGSTGDIEEEPVGAIVLVPDRDGRRIAHQPHCQALQGRLVCFRIDGAHLQSFRSGACIGDPIADLEAGVFSRLIGGRDHRTAGSILGEDEWPFGINRIGGRGIACLRSEKARGRPSGEPD